jgi:hypothetical protein
MKVKQPIRKKKAKTTMAAKAVTISGVLYDKKGRTVQNVTLIGFMSDTGIQIGGGPIIPEAPPEVSPPDLGIWQDPGGYNPDNPSTPLPPDQPPAEIQKPIEWHVAWSEDTGWIVVGTPTGEHVTPSKK